MDALIKLTESDYLLHDYTSEIHETKKVERELFLDKNGLTNIYRHNRSPKTLFLAFIYFFNF